MSPKQRRDLGKRISKTFRKVVKINLLKVLTDNVIKPVTKKIKHKGLIDIRKDKVKEEFHYSPQSKLQRRLRASASNRENENPESVSNVRCIEFFSSSDDPSSHHKKSLRQQLVEFAKKHNPEPELFEDLLLIMKSNGLRVPREVYFDKKFEVLQMSCGSYLNIGIERALKNYYRPDFIRGPLPLTVSPQHQEKKILLMDIACYIVKSQLCNGLKVPQCMIIFGRICCDVFDDPFIIGIYYGNFPTPSIGNEIMKPFVIEMLSFFNRELIIGSSSFTIKLKAFVCDPVSNSLVTCTSLPNSLFGCSKCNQKANLEIDCGFTSFPPVPTLPTLRSDDDFKYFIQNEHHIVMPLLAQLDIGLISQFAIDYKTIAIGVMKHLMVNLWLRGKLDFRLNKETQSKISRELLMMTTNCPREFEKRPHSLKDIDDWNCSDWNNFLLYYSPIALKSRMPQKFYVHFLYLHLAMRICMSSDATNSAHNSFVVGQMLNTFLADFSILYGKDKLDYNVHNLLHLETVQRELGPMKKLNGFFYENQIQMFDSIIDASKTDVNLEEIGEKIHENSNSMVENKINDLINTSYPYVDSKGDLIFKDYAISILDPDNHVLMKDGVIKVEAICNDAFSKEILIIGKKYMRVDIMFQAPLSNQKLLLVAALSPLYTFKLTDLVCKAVKFSTRDGIFIQPLIT